MTCAHLGTVRAVLPTAAVPHFQVVFAGESRIYAVQTHTQRGSPPLMPDGDWEPVATGADTTDTTDTNSATAPDAASRTDTEAIDPDTTTTTTTVTTTPTP